MKSILNLGKFKCQKCGLCCYLSVGVIVEGKHFVPVPFTVKDFDEKEKKYLSLQVCESFDRETRRCKDYENRPPACKRFFCNEKPSPQVLNIQGVPSKTLKPKRIILPNREMIRRK